MHADERAIRTLIDTWMQATAAGDLARLGTLMAEDVVYLQPNQPPMRGRDEFMKRLQGALGHIRITATSDIQEIHISGDLAYCWNHLTVTMIPLRGGEPKRHTGHVLSVLRRGMDGNWVIARDANLLTPETPGTQPAT